MAPRRNRSSTATASVSAPTPEASPPPSIEWVPNKGRFHAFHTSIDAGDYDIQEILEFETTGVLTRAFLKADAKSHTVYVSLAPSEIERIKTIVRSVPNFREPGYRWPLEDGNAKFTSKDNLEAPYGKIWDARNIDIHGIQSRTPLTIDDMEQGCRVFIEYTISPYSAKRARPSVEGFEAGTTLQLLSIGLLERPDKKLDFQSRKKRRRMAA